MKNLNRLLIKPSLAVKDALKQMDKEGEKILYVIDKKQKLLGTLTDGDIRRFFLNNGKLNQKIEKCYNKNPIVLKNHDEILARNILLKHKIESVPVIDENGKIIDCFIWDEVLADKEYKSPKKINIPVVIMAGGTGTRLDPFTRILPKPLIPIGDKAAIEVIMDRFYKIGTNKFYLTLNYKGEMIKSYFDNLQVEYKINYIYEKKFLGTAGSLKFLPNTIKGTFIVTNCDIIAVADYYDVLNLHLKNKNLLTIIGAFQHYVIPYGIIKFKEKGEVLEIAEKPEYDFTINTGVYLLQPEVLNFIPSNKKFDMTDLINMLLENKHKVGVYPISEKSYIDIGQWKEYKKNIKQLILE